ncbi:MAG: nucleotidyltransferase domain-containing protein [Candidatus Asgardarchaeum sp.]
MLKNLEKIKNILIKIFDDDKNVEFAYIFGSMVNGRTHPLSDIDIAVYLNDDSLKSIMRLNARIIDKLGENIDLLVLNRAPYSLRYIVISNGILIFSRNEEHRIEFESKAMLLGIDEKNALDAIEKSLIERYLK